MVVPLDAGTQEFAAK